MKKKMYHILEKGSHGSKVNGLFDYCITALIILNILALMLQTFATIRNSPYYYLFHIFELISITIFTVEYILRLYIAQLTHPASKPFHSIIKFMISPYGLIDLIAILPFYLPFLLSIDLRFLRLIRLARIFRIFKINRYNNSIGLVLNVVRDKKPELIITGFISCLVLIMSAFLMYEVEGNVQPEHFSNILDCMWWAISTLTTVGYGDVYPVTGLGKVLSAVIAVLGIGIIALPTGIISSGFMQKISHKEHRKRCPHCGEKID